MATADQVDTKLGVVIAALASIAALYSATAAVKVAGLLFLVPAVIAFVGFRAREWQNPPDPRSLSEKYMGLGKAQMQLQGLAVIPEAYSVYQDQLDRKSALFNLSLILTLVAALIVLVISLVMPAGK